jgi:hypothetical protein
MSSNLEVHYGQVAREIVSARVVPLLGAGANLCGRTCAWQPGSDGLPSGGELAVYLGQYFGLPEPSSTDLVRVSQQVSATLGADPLYLELHRLFERQFSPNALHQLLASLPPMLRARRSEPYASQDVHQLIVTTNYDDALEAAFRAAGEEYELVSYVSDGEHRGRLLHRAPDGKLDVITSPNDYPGLSLEERTVILKIHGAVDRDDPDRDSYVITEDDYIDYLTRTDISLLLPPSLVEKLRRSHILFLGYSLRDWNLRAIFHRIWQERRRNSTSWAIQVDADAVDVRFWQNRGVEILNVALEEYVEALRRHLDALSYDDRAVA